MNSQADAIAEAAGCQIYAATYRELIIVTCEGPSERAASGIQAMKQLLHPISANADALAREREVIRNEIAIAKSDAKRFSLDELWNAACKDSPFGFDTLGDPQTMSQFDPQFLNNLFDETFCGANCFLAFSCPEVSVKEAGAAVAHLKTGAPKPLPPFPAIRTSRTENKRLRGVMVGFAMQADKQALWSVMSHLLRIAANARGLEIECTFGRASSGGIVSFWFPNADENAVKDLLKSFASSKFTETQMAAAKRLAKSENDPQTLPPLEAARSACIFGALGLKNISSADLDAVAASQADAAAAAFDPAAAVWLIGKRQ